MIELRKCLKPDCMRKVKLGIEYCCTPCAIAAAGRHEVDQHSTGCDQRTAERGECDDLEALLLRQYPAP